MTSDRIGEKSRRTIALTEKYAAHNYSPLKVSFDRAEGVWVWDEEGRKYLDCQATYSAVNHGHRHPRIIAAVERQLQKITSVSRAYHNSEAALYYKELAELCGVEMVHPMNTGAEAVEKATFKIARKWGYTVKGIPENKAELIFFAGNFHGRTQAIISASTEEDYRRYFGPYTPGIVFARYGDIDDLRRVIGPNTAGIVVEPIQGEGGVIVPPDGYLRAIRDLCTAENILMIADEVQTGFGRTGYPFACDYEQVKPDLYILGKALGGGILPVSAVVGSAEVIGVLQPGDDGSTFGGNPLAAAVAREAIKVLVEERLPQRSRSTGDYFLSGLRAMQSPLVKEVRGRGLMIGMEFTPEAGPARRFAEKLLNLKAAGVSTSDHGNVTGIITKETHESVLRFTPPLVIERREIDWVLECVAQILK